MTSSEHEQHPQPGRGGRLSQSAILAMLLSRGSGEHSAVTLTRNAKGATQIEVTVRTGEGGGPQSVEEASELAQATYDVLRAKYPPPTQGEGA